MWIAFTIGCFVGFIIGINIMGLLNIGGHNFGEPKQKFDNQV